MKPDHDLPPPLPPSLLTRLAAACGILVVAGVLVRGHPHFGFEAWPAATGALAFGSAWAGLAAARTLRRVLRRPVDYYHEP